MTPAQGSVVEVGETVVVVELVVDVVGATVVVVGAVVVVASLTVVVLTAMVVVDPAGGSTVVVDPWGGSTVVVVVDEVLVLDVGTQLWCRWCRRHP